MIISASAKSKLKAFAANLHPRYPKGHPMGGKFMPKGSPEYNATVKGAIARGTGQAITPVKQQIKTAATNLAKKGVDFAVKNKGMLATTGAMIATGSATGAIAGAVGGSIASAATRSLITIGKKAHSRITAEKHKEAYAKGESLFKIAKQMGADFMSDLRSPKFQRQLEKAFIEDLAYGAIATTVSSFVPVMGAGDVAAIKTSGGVGKIGSAAVQRLKKKVKAYGDSRASSG